MQPSRRTRLTRTVLVLLSTGLLVSLAASCGANGDFDSSTDDDANNGNNAVNNGGNNGAVNNGGNNGNNGDYYSDGTNNGGDWEEPLPPDGDLPDTNDFVDASVDNLATFSIDVDTASYTLMRRAVTSGYLPDPNTVRVEEFINFFDYDYEAPAPNSPEPFAVHLESAPSRFGANLQLMRVGIQGEAIDPAAKKPANLIFLVDVSGSMSDPLKLGLVKYSLRRLLDELGGDDTIGIVAYAGADRIVLEPTSVSERDTILSAIDHLEAGGSTNGAAGIRTAYELAQSVFVADGVNRVVLCTDGDFNVGVTGDALVDLVVSWRDRNIFLSVLGFAGGYGTYGFDDRFLEALTNEADGNYAFVDTEREADRAVGFKLMGTLQVIAKDVKIQVELNPAVVARYRLIGYENRNIADDDFVDDTVDAGEIGSGHTVTAYLELELIDGVSAVDAAAEPMATVHIRYKKPEGGASEEIIHGLPLGDAHASFADASDSFRFGAAVAEFAEILRYSPHVDGADFEAVNAVAASAVSLETPEHTEFRELVSQASGMYP